MGVPTLVVEMGVGHRINNAYCHQLIDGIFNMLIHMGIWEDEAPQVKQPIISTEGEVSIINAAQTGVLLQQQTIWEQLRWERISAILLSR